MTSQNNFLFLPSIKLITAVGIAVATGVVAAGVAGLNAESGRAGSKASEVVAYLVSRAVLLSH